MYLGIDLGTSEIKLLLLDMRQRIVATTGEALTLSRPQPRWSEQHPLQWWTAADAAMQRLAATHPAAMAEVRATGLSGQMHGAVLLDEADQVLRPAILWNDGRAGAECAELEATCPELHAIAGNLAMPGFTAPKLLWVKKHEPELFARVAKVLLPKDWLRLQLTGEAISDLSDAAGTLWLDVAKRRWSPELLAATGLTEAQMPALAEGSAVAGRLLPALAARWGLKRGEDGGLPIAGGGGDNAASAVGIGAVRPNQGFVSLGTSGVIFLTNDRFRPNPASAVHAFCHALPATWHQMSVMLSAASALRWVRELTGLASEAELVAKVAALSPAERDAAPLFLPYLSGERTPHNDANAQGVLFGLTGSHSAAHLGYAVMEGVGFGLLDGWRALGAAPGAVQALSLVGGGARSPEWAQLLASTLGVALHTHEGGEAGGALGAARLAWLADLSPALDADGSLPGSLLADICPAPPMARLFEPNAAETERLAPRQARWAQLYPRLRNLFPAG
ncbi:xylulokinase [Ideonella azotifigens]|uniref:Xylulose kinase n=1 Tax=Ideonella azotifigens TaxID=513160 RepID=A0ABP3VGP6_9BURK|nr:xylulokinase [Ideonella azotifigens]MCD2339139.1 xylulokinase [Ideonella azotifigens]